MILCLIAAIGSAASVLDMPAPPCAGPPKPAYPETLDMPTIEVWLDQHALESWRAPACLDWQDKPATALIAVSGLFRHHGTLEDLLTRLGAVARYTSIYYWSRSKQRWRHLFERTAALSAPVRTAERSDFEANDFREGNQLYILQNEAGPVGEVIQRISVIDRTDDRIVIGTTNFTSARIALLRLFGPGGSDMRLWIEREAEDRWRYFSVTRLSGAALLSRPALERSYVNRAEAIFRYLADAERPREVR